MRSTASGDASSGSARTAARPFPPSASTFSRTPPPAWRAHPPAEPIGHPRATAFLIAGAVIATDQVTKWLALEKLADGPQDLIGAIVRLELTRNSGAAFGLLRGAGSWLALLAAVVAVVVFLSVRHGIDNLTLAALGLVLGGSLGNLVDRLFRGDGLADGLVVDFIDVGPWPNFNVADSAIVIGIVLILWESMRHPSSAAS